MRAVGSRRQTFPDGNRVQMCLLKGKKVSGQPETFYVMFLKNSYLKGKHPSVLFQEIV